MASRRTSRRRRRLRRRIGGLVGVLALLVVSAVVLLSTTGPRAPAAGPEPDPVTPTPRPVTSATAAPSFGRVASDPPPPSSTATTSTAATSTAADAVTLDVDVLPDGRYRVEERLDVTTPVNRIELAVAPPSGVGSELAGSRPVVEGLSILVDGRTVEAGAGELRDARTVTLDRPATSVRLRYEVRDAAVRTSGGRADRALGSIRPLTRALGDGAPVRVRVTGAGVLNVTCPELRGADQRCARADAEDGWLVERLTMASALVLVQLDLLQA